MIDETDDMNKLYIIFFVNYNFFGYLIVTFSSLKYLSILSILYAAQGIRFIFTKLPLSYNQKESG